MTISSPKKLFWFVLLLLSLTTLTGAGALAAQSGTPQPPEPISSGDMNDLSFPPLVGGSPAGIKPDSGMPPAPVGRGTLFQSGVDAPAITVWYSTNQTFGQNGDPQKWVNIVGNVNGAGNVTLSYTLNGGSPRVISVGPNSSRLDKKGDFNIDIDYTDLNPGNNTVAITAVDASGQTNANVTINYQAHAGNWTPGTYTIDFSTATKVNDVAQVIDGNWVLDGGKARPAQNLSGYDRLIGVGDISWRDYTVTVPVTVHSIVQDKSPAFGLILRWRGHNDSGSGHQPFAGWRPNLGGLAWYRYEKGTQTEGLQLLGHGGNQIGSDGFNLDPGTTYMLKANVTSDPNPAKTATYRFKVWPEGQSEPAGWDIESKGLTGEPRNGSIVLLAHHADVSFGNVTVNLASTEPKPSLTLNKIGTGDGTVSAVPQKATYRFGEDVVLTATAAQGSIFAGWQGDASGNNPSASVEMFADRTVTAVFADPEVDTPVSDDFSGCVLDPSLWTFVNPLGVATMSLNGSQAEINIPSGQSHDFWTSGLNAPRIMQFASDDDFEIEVKFDSAMSTKNQMQGVIIEGNDDKYIRFIFLHDGSKYRVQAHTFTSGASPVSRINQEITIDAPMSLRIKRLSKQYWTVSYFPNAIGQWANAGSAFDFAMEVTAYGPFVGTSGNNPAFSGKIDYFFNTSAPISPEDNSRKLNITTTGSGTVERDPEKESYACDEVVTLTAVPEAGYKFSSWSGALTGTTNPTTIVMNQTKSVTANFVPDVQYTVTTAVTGNGTVALSPPGPTYPPGTEVTATASPDIGYLFANWSGDQTGSTNPLSFVVNSNMSITANFQSAPPRTLAINVVGAGTVAKVPDKPTYLNGETVNLTVAAGTGHSFAGWSGDATGMTTPLPVLMDGDKNITATFKENIYTLSLAAAPGGAGTVTPSPAKAAYFDGEVVALTPVPANGYLFSHWSGDLTGATVPGQLTMTKNSTVTANFVPAGTFTVDITTNGDGLVLKDLPGPDYPYGTQLKLTAVANSGSEFTSWSGDITSTENPVTVTVTKDMLITANFDTEGIYALTILPSVGGSVVPDPERELYSQDQQVTLTAVPELGKMFAGWGEDLSGTQNPLVITMTSDVTVSAAFIDAPDYTLNLTTNGPGTAAVDPPGTTFQAGTTVTLTATPQTGFVFTGWSGDVESNINPYSLLMDGNKNIVANFDEDLPVVSDDFAGCGPVSPMWSWYDPNGRATYKLTGSNLQIVIPPVEASDTNYDIWRPANNSARLMQNVANTNFEVIVRLGSIPNALSQTHGVLVEDDADSFLRVDFYHDGTNLRFFGGTVTVGQASRNRFSEIIDLSGIDSPQLSIRVQRVGDTFRNFYRLTDDGQWTGFSGSNFRYPLDVSRVGVFAATPGATAPGHTALFDYFFNDDEPIVDEDANAPGITINKVGQGNVTLSPAAGPYTCGQSVQVSASAASGWRFQNYSGALNGTNPSQNLTVSGKHAITATFTPMTDFKALLPVVIR